MDFRYVPPDLRKLDALSAEVACCSIWEDEWPMLGLAGLVDWRLAGRLSHLAKGGFLTGAKDEVVMMPARPGLPFEKLIVLGLGKKSAFEDAVVTRAAKRLLETLEGLQVRKAVVELPGRADRSIPAERAAQLVRAAVGESDVHDAWWLVEDADGEKAIVGSETRRA
jgi:hypothetical protein